jgi:hypothetical protein
LNRALKRIFRLKREEVTGTGNAIMRSFVICNLRQLSDQIEDNGMDSIISTFREFVYVYINTHIYIYIQYINWLPHLEKIPDGPHDPGPPEHDAATLPIRPQHSVAYTGVSVRILTIVADLTV